MLEKKKEWSKDLNSLYISFFLYIVLKNLKELEIKKLKDLGS